MTPKGEDLAILVSSIVHHAISALGLKELHFSS